VSRNYKILGSVLVGLGLVVGLVKLSERVGNSGDEQAATTVTEVATTVAIPTTATTFPIVASNSTTTAAPTSSVTDAIDGDPTTTSTAAPILAAPPPCTITEPLQQGATGEAVECVQSQLSANGYAVSGGEYDADTDQAVRAYQTAKGFDADGVTGRITAQALGIWAGGPEPVAALDGQCPDTGRAAIIDRDGQRGWLCDAGVLSAEFPLSSAWSQPDPGTDDVYARDLEASSNLNGEYTTMTHFVAFSKGKFRGARIAFHSVPKFANGEFVQALDTVGAPEMRGLSAGCLRLLPEDAQRMWDFLQIGDQVKVIS
jgi:peptidoglycan hydrolase-like protein with peptidoglycan-binding domain